MLVSIRLVFSKVTISKLLWAQLKTVLHAAQRNVAWKPVLPLARSGHAFHAVNNASCTSKSWQYAGRVPANISDSQTGYNGRIRITLLWFPPGLHLALLGLYPHPGF